ncbi:MAG: peptidylprolyl isomerase [Chromatiaceae bacterium]|jgi:cyclophilin family peptidyl-prolyl cis-trans isomerase
MKPIALSLLAGLLFLVCSAAQAETVAVLLKTSKGDITLELDAEKAPQSVENFLAYVDAGFYDGTIFHRVIPDFMIQGGGLDPDMTKKATREPVQNEAKNGLKNQRGTIAMARTQAPHSATAQFFINHKDNTNLDYPSFDGWGYAVFGRVTDGMDVVDAIAATPTTTRSGRRDVPQETILIESVTRLQ